jgi:hypothetical protein
MFYGLEHRASEEAFAIIERTDLPRGQRTLRFVVFELGATSAERFEVSEAGGAAITRLRVQDANGIQGLSGAGGGMQHSFASP